MSMLSSHNWINTDKVSTNGVSVLPVHTGQPIRALGTNSGRRRAVLMRRR